jgi:hypothetical protein
LTEGERYLTIKLFTAALASLPLVSILASVWIYLETAEARKLAFVVEHLLVLLSLVFFLIY